MIFYYVVEYKQLEKQILEVFQLKSTEEINEIEISLSKCKIMTQNIIGWICVCIHTCVLERMNEEDKQYIFPGECPYLRPCLQNFHQWNKIWVIILM